MSNSECDLTNVVLEVKGNVKKKIFKIVVFHFYICESFHKCKYILVLVLKFQAYQGIILILKFQ